MTLEESSAFMESMSAYSCSRLSATTTRRSKPALLLSVLRPASVENSHSVSLWGWKPCCDHCSWLCVLIQTWKTCNKIVLLNLRCMPWVKHYPHIHKKKKYPHIHLKIHNSFHFWGTQMMWWNFICQSKKTSCGFCAFQMFNLHKPELKLTASSLHVCFAGNLKVLTMKIMCK